ncbi:MAG: FecR domain-containing protein [Bacteroidota bacterium]
MKYTEYQSHDFIKEESFVKWVLGQDAHLADFWEKWITEHPEKEQEVEEARQIVLGIQYKKESVQMTDQEYLSLYEDILKNESTAHHPVSGSDRVPYYRLVAAAAILVFTAVVVLYQFYWQDQDKGQASDVKLSTTVKTTKRGEKLTFRLPDGSMVKLNAASSLSYSSDYGSEKRVVELVGEAFFEVTKNPDKPFLVNTNLMTVKALGTSFNVSSYQSADSQAVTLVSGKVAVNKLNDGNSVILNPGEQASTAMNNSGINVAKVNTTHFINWKNDVLVLDSDDFDEIKSRLELWYGVDFTIVGKPARRQYNGTFQRESLENVLQSLAYSAAFQFEIDGKNVIIKF